MINNYCYIFFLTPEYNLPLKEVITNNLFLLLEINAFFFDTWLFGLVFLVLNNRENNSECYTCLMFAFSGFARAGGSPRSTWQRRSKGE